MRYDKTVTFTEEKTKYDTIIGKEVTKIVHSKTIRANITDASEKVMTVAFGSIRQGAQVVRVQGAIPFKPTNLYINDSKYKVAMVRILRRKTTYILDEVFPNG
ncbi:TPA: hypothetical protein I0F94_RS01995 [Enterococcus faecalis]|nr:hypothetical protein [Enterococcus faecalis]